MTTPRAERLTLDAIYEIAKTLTSAPDPIADMPSVLNVLSSFIGLKHGALALLSQPDDHGSQGAVNPYIIAASTHGTQDQGAANDAIPEPVARMVFRTGVPLFSWDPASEFGADCLPPYIQGKDVALLAVPLRGQGETPLVVGVLCAYRYIDDGYGRGSDDDLGVLTMVSSLLEQSLRFRQLIVRDRERTMRDARRAISEARSLRETVVAQKGADIEGIIGSSPEIKNVIHQISKVAETRASVLLRGESGTGKELFARAIHALSDRKKAPFVRVNCAALSPTLLESELFGHEKGAFTGAQSLKKGRFELADGGTLFLDEIGEIGPEFQAKLLRVLQEGEFERVGGTKTIKTDVRLVSATNKDLEQAVAEGSFRADLYFRICVVPIVLPALRERPGDIMPLAQHFLDKFNSQNGTELHFANEAFKTICQCKFPGNVRELENCVYRAAAMSDGEVILGEEMACNQNACLSAELWRLQSGDSSPIGGLAAGLVVTPTVAPTVAAPPSMAAPAASSPPAGCPVQPQPRKTANTAREELISAMEQAGWVQAKAARLLGMTPRQISYALKKHGIEIQKF
ncbi:MAG: nif-specific transcriptional activator NifA [Mangrovicoccus sp.]|nr:nif-specific transcriptional activator NifA [Mangrovicoccus sp.]